MDGCSETLTGISRFNHVCRMCQMHDNADFVVMMARGLLTLRTVEFTGFAARMLSQMLKFKLIPTL